MSTLIKDYARELNDGRAKRAETAVDAYLKKHDGSGMRGEVDKETAIRDLLTDLMHLAQRSKYRCDFEYELEIARNAFDAEVRP